MTSAISLNKRRVLNFFTFTLKKQTPLTILVTAFALLFCPGTLLSQIMERIANYGIASDKRPDMNGYFLGYTIGIFVVGIGLSLLLTASNFSFLFCFNIYFFKPYSFAKFSKPAREFLILL